MATPWPKPVQAQTRQKPSMEGGVEWVAVVSCRGHGKGEAVFSESVAAGTVTTLQWENTHPGIFRQYKLVCGVGGGTQRLYGWEMRGLSGKSWSGRIWPKHIVQNVKLSKGKKRQHWQTVQRPSLYSAWPRALPRVLLISCGSRQSPDEDQHSTACDHGDDSYGTILQQIIQSLVCRPSWRHRSIPKILSLLIPFFDYLWK